MVQNSALGPAEYLTEFHYQKIGQNAELYKTWWLRLDLNQ